MAAGGTGEEHLHRAEFFFAYNADARHHGADEHKDEAHHARHKVVFALLRGVVEQTHAGRHGIALGRGRGSDLHRGGIGACQQTLDERGGVGGAHGRLVGLRAVGEQLHRRAAASAQAVGKAIFQHDGHVGLAATHHFLRFDCRVGYFYHREIAVGVERLLPVRHAGVAAFVDDDERRAAHLRGHGVTEEHDEHDGHHEQDEHRAAIAENL